MPNQGKPLNVPVLAASNEYSTWKVAGAVAMRANRESTALGRDSDPRTASPAPSVVMLVGGVEVSNLIRHGTELVSAHRVGVREVLTAGDGAAAGRPGDAGLVPGDRRVEIRGDWRDGAASRGVKEGH